MFKSNSIPWRCFINSQARDMIVSVARPKKSTLSNPRWSMVDISNCVTVLIGVSSFLLVGRLSGIYSTTGLSVMITPAACVPAFRITPSISLAVSTSSRTYDFVSYSCLNSGIFSSASSIVTALPGTLGIILAILSTSFSGISNTLATSRMAARAFIFPKVMIEATLSSPYRCAQYSMILWRRSS